MAQKRILVFSSAYLPGFRAGGPIQSIANLVEGLCDEFDFYIVTSDRDLGDEQAYCDIEYNRWVSVGKAKVRYLMPKDRSALRIKRLMEEVNCDVIYLNGLWHGAFTILPLLVNRFWVGHKPVVQAVRGMLGDAVMNGNCLKKKLCLRFFYRLLGFNNRTIYQCSSDQEADEVRKYLGQSAQTGVAPNVPGRNVVSEPVRSKTDGVLRMVFLSRIAPKKNLDGALKCLLRVRRNIEYHIYGTAEDMSYWRECQELIKQMPEHVRVVFHGSLKPGDMLDELSQYDCFFLPTHHENFGHVIHEALRAGLPVLLSDKTPWHDVETNGCGWEFSDDDYEGFAGRIDELAVFEPNTFYELKLKALDYAKRFAKDNEVVEKNRDMFEKAAMSGQGCS